MWNAKADGLTSSICLERLGITYYDIEQAERRGQQLRAEAIAKTVKAFIGAAKGLFAARRTRSHLMNIDSRLLEDIGLTRYEVHDAFGKPSLGFFTAALTPLRKAVKGIIAWKHRQDVYRDLVQLDDHLLEDIGVNRADIEAIAFRGKVRKPVLHSPVSVDSIRAAALPGVAAGNAGRERAA